MLELIGAIAAVASAFFEGFGCFASRSSTRRYNELAYTGSDIPLAKQKGHLLGKELWRRRDMIRNFAITGPFVVVYLEFYLSRQMRYYDFDKASLFYLQRDVESYNWDNRLVKLLIKEAVREAGNNTLKTA